MEHLSRNNRSMKEVKKHSRGSWRPDTKFRQEKLLQSEDNLLKVGARTQRIKWKCPPKVSLRDEWRIAAGEESVELEAEKRREKSVPEQVYVHPYSIPANPSVALDLDDQSLQEDSRIFHVPLIPIEELEEGEMLPPCNSCASSKPITNATSEIDPATAAIAAFARSIQSDLIDPDLLTLLLCNPQMVNQLMQGLAPSNSNTKHAEVQSMAISRPVELKELHPLPGRKPEPVFGLNPSAKPAPSVSSMPGTSSSKGLLDERRTLPHAGMPNVAGHNPLPRAEHSSSRKERLKKLVNEYGAHESVGHKPFPSTNMLVSRNPVPPCKFFNSSKGCWNGSKCRFKHDVEVPDTKRRKLTLS